MEMWDVYDNQRCATGEQVAKGSLSEGQYHLSVHGEFRMFLPHQFRHHFGEFQSTASLFEDGADEGSQDDDDADRRECPAEASSDDSRDFIERNAINNG